MLYIRQLEFGLRQFSAPHVRHSQVRYSLARSGRSAASPNFNIRFPGGYISRLPVRTIVHQCPPPSDAKRSDILQGFCLLRQSRSEIADFSLLTASRQVVLAPPISHFPCLDIAVPPQPGEGPALRTPAEPSQSPLKNLTRPPRSGSPPRRCGSGSGSAWRAFLGRPPAFLVPPSNFSPRPPPAPRHSTMLQSARMSPRA